MLKIPTLKSNSGGFTLIEIIVSLGIFAIVAVVAIGALMTASRLNRKAQATKLVVDNLNFALDSMTLKIRRGGLYTCLDGGSVNNPPSVPTPLGANCAGGTALAFRITEADSSGNPIHRVYVYRLWDDGGRGELQVALPDESSIINPRPLLPFVPITVSALDIGDLEFNVLNSAITDVGQPKVIFTLNGSALVLNEDIELSLQTTISQRQ